MTAAKAQSCRWLPLLERKKRLKAILPRHKLIALSNHGKGCGAKFFAKAELRHLEGIMAPSAPTARMRPDAGPPTEAGPSSAPSYWPYAKTMPGGTRRSLRTLCNGNRDEQDVARYVSCDINPGTLVSSVTESITTPPFSRLQPSRCGKSEFWWRAVEKRPSRSISDPLSNLTHLSARRSPAASGLARADTQCRAF